MAQYSSTEHLQAIQLAEAGIRFNQLVTSCGRGERYLINDKHPEDGDRAIGINLCTNEGFENINI
jgi:hypothetical protein